MIVEEFRISGGFLRTTLKLSDDDLYVKENNLIFSRERRISLSELSSNYLIVKQGIPGLLTMSIYIFILGIILDILQRRLCNSTIPFREIGAIIMLVSFLLEHLQLYKVAQFPFKKESQAVRISLKHDQFIEELISRIGKANQNA